jgi:hypothetical protein
MKRFTLFLLSVISVSLLLCVSASVKNSRHTTRSSNNLMRHKTHHKNRQDEDDCGCKIVYSFNEQPKILPKKPYKRRWPKIPELPKPVVVPVVVTCQGAEGQSLLAQLRKMFPLPVTKRKPKSSSSGGAGGVVTTTTSSSSSSGAPAALTGFAKSLLDEATRFKAKITADNKKTPVRRSPITKKKTKIVVVKEKLTPEKRERLAMMAKKEAFLKRARKTCYSKIRRYLDPEYKIRYKGKKCHIIGRLLKTCFDLS